MFTICSGDVDGADGGPGGDPVKEELLVPGEPGILAVEEPGECGEALHGAVAAVVRVWVPRWVRAGRGGGVRWWAGGVAGRRVELGHEGRERCQA